MKRILTLSTSRPRRLHLLDGWPLGFLMALTFAPLASAPFGVRSDGGFWAVGIGAGLVSKEGQDSGTIPFTLWGGTKLNARRDSGLASGFGGGGVSQSRLQSGLHRASHAAPPRIHVDGHEPIQPRHVWEPPE